MILTLVLLLLIFYKCLLIDFPIRPPKTAQPNEKAEENTLWVKYIQTPARIAPINEPIKNPIPS